MRRSLFLTCLGLAVLVHAFAASTELNPVRTQPRVQDEPAVQRVIVKLRALAPGDAAPARLAAVAEALVKRVGLTLRGSHRIAPHLHALRVEPAAGGESIAATL